MSVSQSKRTFTVYALDSDHGFLYDLEKLLQRHGILTKCFHDSWQLLASPIPDGPSCLILDYQLECGVEAADVHRKMVESGWIHPIIYLSSCCEIDSVVRAMKNGADNYLTKPVDPGALTEAVFSALNKSKENLGGMKCEQQAKRLVDGLSRREREIVGLVARGYLNKEIADQLNLSIVTVKFYRGRAMKKLGAGNAAQFVQIASLGGIIDDKSMLKNNITENM